MRIVLAAALILFAAAFPATAEADGARSEQPADYLWQTRSPDFITALCVKQGLHPRCRAIAWWGRKPCIVMTPPPPAETAPEIVIRRWLGDLNHERRHCREERNFHKGYGR